VFETFGGDLPVYVSQPKAAMQNNRATDCTNIQQAPLLTRMSKGCRQVGLGQMDCMLWQLFFINDGISRIRL